jgi:hypothetical protein
VSRQLADASARQAELAIVERTLVEKRTLAEQRGVSIFGSTSSLAA